MAGNKIGQIPEFTDDEPTGEEEVKEAETDEVPEEEKETPTEPPAEEQPAEAGMEPTEGDDTKEKLSELERAVQGLQNERVNLLKEISELKGQRREIKRDELIKVEEKLDELKDLHPDDVSLVDRILRSKGYITKDQASSMFYKAVQEEELAKFLNKYPEYKPENDPSNTNWNSLEREFTLYRRPDDPHQIGNLLERAHQNLSKTSLGGRELSAQKHKAEVAGVGKGGSPRSSSPKTTYLDADKKAMLRQGGFSEEDISEMENSLE